MSEAIVVGIIGVVGSLLVAWYRDYLQRWQTRAFGSPKEQERLTPWHDAVGGNQTYHERRIMAIIDKAIEYSSKDKQQEWGLYVAAIVAGVFFAAVEADITAGVTALFAVGISGGIYLELAARRPARQEVGNEITMPKLDSSTLFVLRELVKQHPNISVGMKKAMLKTIKKEL